MQWISSWYKARPAWKKVHEAAADDDHTDLLRRAINYGEDLLSADSLEAIDPTTGRTPLHNKLEVVLHNRGAEARFIHVRNCIIAGLWLCHVGYATPRCSATSASLL